MKRIGILGGTFNPVHNAHLAMAQAAMEQYNLSKVLFMPSKNPPHKEKEEIVSEEHRRRMIGFAIQDYPQFHFSDFELRREGITYTSDTLRLLKEEHPEWEIYFILGGDSLNSFLKWHEPENILKYAVVLAAPRAGVKFSEIEKLCKKISHKLSGNVLPFRMKQLKISSRQIRKKTKKGESLAGICPENVCRYIRFHGLYGTSVFSYPLGQLERGKWEGLYETLSSTLPKKRYLHSLGVADTALLLACSYGHPSREDAMRIRLAGLLHDCAKYLTGAELIRCCEENGIVMTEVEKSNTSLLHGKAGAYLAEKIYGVSDREILSAIRYHTTGRPDMGFLEKIIYIADFIEPGRDMVLEPHSLSEIRQVCFRDLDKGLCMVLRSVLDHVLAAGPVDELTVETYEYYKSRQK